MERREFSSNYFTFLSPFLFSHGKLAFRKLAIACGNEYQHCCFYYRKPWMLFMLAKRTKRVYLQCLLLYCGWGISPSLWLIMRTMLKLCLTKVIISMQDQLQPFFETFSFGTIFMYCSSLPGNSFCIEQLRCSCVGMADGASFII